MIRYISFRMAIGFTGVLAAAVAAWPQTDFSLIQKYRVLQPGIQKAQKDLDQGRIDRCQSELAKCFETVPDHHAARYVEAQLFYKKGDFSSALESMNKAKAGHRHLVDILSKFQTQKILKQIGDSDAMSQLDPILAASLANTGCQQGPIAGKLQDNNRSLNETKRDTQEQMGKKADACPAEYDYFTGNCQFKLKRYDEAAASYREAVATDPVHASAWNNLINLLFMAKDFAEARAVIERAEANKVMIHPGLKKAVFEGVK
jgi:tetratricopeptide (TPR) repeat protein